MMAEQKKQDFALRDYIVIALIFIIGMYFASLPVQNNEMPFGEGDGAHQFGKSDYFYSTDKVHLSSPFFIYATWYSSPNAYTGNPYDGALYPPFYFIDGALFQSFTGERLMGLNLFTAFMALVLAGLSTYFFMRKLFGFYPAMLSGFMMLFAYRSLMGYVWGQRAILAAFAFIPIILYCYYKYTKSYLAGDHKPIYLGLLTVLLATASLFHAVTLIFLFVIISIYTIILWIKHKKLPFDIKAAAIAAILFLIVFAPFAYQLSKSTVGKPKEFELVDGNAFFKWYEPEGQDNQQLYSYKTAYGGYWTLPLLLLGLILLFLKKKEDKYLLLFSWLLGLYIMFHLPAFNQTQFRLDQMIKAEAFIFYPLMALGLMMIPGFIKMPKQTKSYLRMGLAALLIIVFGFTMVKPFFVSLHDTYDGILRITPVQYEFTGWLDKNIEDDEVAMLFGPITYPKERFMQVLSHKALKNTVFSLQEPEQYEASFNRTLANVIEVTQGEVQSIKYAIFDMTDISHLSEQEQMFFIGAMSNFQKNHGLEGKQPIYSQENIFVFDLEAVE